MGKLFYNLRVHSIGNCSDSKVFFVVSFADVGDAKRILDGGLQIVLWKVVLALKVLERKGWDNGGWGGWGGGGVLFTQQF